MPVVWFQLRVVVLRAGSVVAEALASKVGGAAMAEVERHANPKATSTRSARPNCLEVPFTDHL